jgi:hypothetical protein
VPRSDATTLQHFVPAWRWPKSGNGINGHAACTKKRMSQGCEKQNSSSFEIVKIDQEEKLNDWNFHHLSIPFYSKYNLDH